MRRNRNEDWADNSETARGGEGWEERRRTGLEVQSMQYERVVVLQLEIEQWRHTQGQHELFTKSNRQSAPAEQNA